MLHFIHTFIKRINKEYEELQYNGRKQKRSTSQCLGVSANQKTKSQMPSEWSADFLSPCQSGPNPPHLCTNSPTVERGRESTGTQGGLATGGRIEAHYMSYK